MKFAKQDCYAVEDVGEAEVRRFIKAGDPLPAHLTPESASDFDERDEPAASGPIAAVDTASAGEDLDALSADELQARADAAGVQVKGTGQGGRVLKGDLVKALQDASA